MATQKLLRSRKICVEDSGLAIAGGKEDFSCRYEQYLNTVSVPIDDGARYGALRELTWWWTGVHCDNRALLKKAHRKGFRGCIHSTFARRMNDSSAGLVLQRQSPGAPVIESLPRCGAAEMENGSRGASRELSLYQTIGGVSMP
jgi:hypothetical protein